jgi:hypothetical protein
MDLREFLLETLQQIVNGVAEAQSKVEGDGEVTPITGWRKEKMPLNTRYSNPIPENGFT